MCGNWGILSLIEILFFARPRSWFSRLLTATGSLLSPQDVSAHRQTAVITRTLQHSMGSTSEGSIKNSFRNLINFFLFFSAYGRKKRVLYFVLRNYDFEIQFKPVFGCTTPQPVCILAERGASEFRSFRDRVLADHPESRFSKSQAVFELSDRS